MKIVVIGGTGLIGSKLVALLRQRGQEVLAASPNSGVNTLTGEGLPEALAGAQVVGCDVKEEGNRETAAMVREAGGSIVTMQPIDLGDPETAGRWVEDAAALNGRIDVLYNNASAARFLPIESFTVEAWQFTVRNELG